MQFRVPNSTYMLHCVRPDLIMLRVTARNLIMWDHVRPTEAWFEEQLPPLKGQPQPLGGGNVDEEGKPRPAKSTPCATCASRATHIDAPTATRDPAGASS